MIIKEYTIHIRIQAERDKDFPSVDGLVNGLNDGLSNDWFSMAEGDDFSIYQFTYEEANNPQLITRAHDYITDLMDQP